MNQMFDKIQMILMMRTSISNNRLSRLNNFCSSDVSILFIFVESTNFKIENIIINIITNSPFNCFFRIVGIIKKKLGQMLVPICQVILIHYYIYCEDWKLAPGPFRILIK